eukprot:COSAG02_NODE_1410_length_12758_cov_67.963504_2_plen_102_part_00
MIYWYTYGTRYGTHPDVAPADMAPRYGTPDVAPARCGTPGVALSMWRNLAQIPPHRGTVSSTIFYYSTGTGTSTSSTLAIITKQRSFSCTGTNVLITSEGH